MLSLILRPAPTESAPFYHHYIAQVPTGDILHILATQLEQAAAYFSTLTEANSLYRYGPGKWSVREALNHMADTERLFTFRAFWIARGIPGELYSFDQNTAATHAEADSTSLAAHLEELHRVRLATLSLFQNLPSSAWPREGNVKGTLTTVRALAYITAGHLAHHLAILHERYR